MTPCISSPLIVSSPVRVRRASTNLNTSPDTVPSRAPSLVIQLARRPEVRNSPVTLPPSCFKVSRMSSRPPAVRPTIAPYQEPLTFSVTRVRSIQSLCAQPIKSTTEIIPKSMRAMGLILSALRRVRLGTRGLPVKGCSPLTILAENLTRHIVSANGQLPAVDSTLIPEGEYIASHVSVDGNG